MTIDQFEKPEMIIDTNLLRNSIMKRQNTEPDWPAENVVKLTSDDISIFPFRFIQLMEFSITKSINRHGQLYMKGVIDHTDHDRYLQSSVYGLNVKVLQLKEDADEVLFDGIIEKISMHQEGELYIMEVYAVTHSYHMDVKRKSRSFQNNAMSYHDLVHSVVSDYDKGNSIVTVDEKALGSFVIQYNETDWQFLTRMASHFHQGLYPSFDMDGPKFHFGVPYTQNRYEINVMTFRAFKDIGTAQALKANAIDGVEGSDFNYFEVTSYDIIPLGSQVTCNERLLYVREAEVKLIKGELRCSYILCSKKGLKQPYRKNDFLQGISVSGQVLDIRRDQVKVFLDEIDASQDTETAHWFPYSTVYASKDGSGWYCMPEKGDRVRVQFANTEDFSAYTVSSVSESDTSRMEDYKVRYIRNPQGMEITMTPNQVIISAGNRSTIVMDQNGNIQIHGQAGVTLSSENNVSISAGNEISMQATDRINLTCGGKAEIDLDSSGVTQLKGSTVYTN